jgi:hypothetical protein
MCKPAGSVGDTRWINGTDRVSNREPEDWLTLPVMDRDRRLTGMLRGQTDNPDAPLGFELNNPWRASLARELTLLMRTG